MSEQRLCPLCHREHEVADDGTIQTWVVSWTGDEAPQFGPIAYLSPERAARLHELREKYPERIKPQTEPDKTNLPGYYSNRVECFIHYEDAIAEYRYVRNLLQKRGDWIRQSKHLTLTEGERALWDDLFGENAVWLA